MKGIVFFFFLLSLSGCAQKQIVISQDGSGSYMSIQQAFDDLPKDNTKPVTFFIKKGIYKERLVLEKGRDHVRLIGEDRENTILTYDNHTGTILPNGDTVNTFTSASFFIYADDFQASNITIQNDAGFSAGQAVAVFAYGDRLIFDNCNLKGFQDVLFCSGDGSRQFYRNCYIEGTTDFIFGPAVSVFQNCQIHSKKNSHVTAASTREDIQVGFVFFDCRLTADSTVNKVSLGRPWRPYASVTYIRCELGSHIIPEGWNNWNKPEREKTVRYAEYKNYGPGGSTEKRAPWSYQLSESDLKKFTFTNIFRGWEPTSN